VRQTTNNIFILYLVKYSKEMMGGRHITIQVIDPINIRVVERNPGY